MQMSFVSLNVRMTDFQSCMKVHKYPLLRNILLFGVILLIYTVYLKDPKSVITYHWYKQQGTTFFISFLRYKITYWFSYFEKYYPELQLKKEAHET